MRYICTILFLLFVIPESKGQAPVSTRLVLIGNAREAMKENSNFLNVVKAAIVLDSATIVMYLGNNTLGPDDTVSLRKEAAIADNTPSKVFFITGYHDWAKGTEPGYKAVQRQQQFISGLGNERIKFYPGDACPGPKNVDLPDGAELLIMDSQWWLHEHNKPDIESGCKYRTKEEILAELEDVPKDEFDKLILFVSHHPIRNTGVHSGTFGLKQHVFPFTDIRKLNALYLPLPVIGSMYPIMRNAVISKQDMNNSSYESFAETGIGTLPGVKEAFKNHPHTIFISGREHSLELLSRGRHYYINSGAASGGGRVRRGKKKDFLSSAQGFAVLEVSENKTVQVMFYEIEDGKATLAHSADLGNYSKKPRLGKDTTTMPMIYSDSTVAGIDDKIANAGGLKRLLIGENYRKEWGMPVKMKVLHIDKEKGGLKIKGIGGGHESRSLQFEDVDGKKWVFRQSNKNLEAVIPDGFQETVASDYVHDLLSGSNPYGALVVPGLQKPLNIVHASPEVYFMPNDTALGVFRPLFANTVGQLEERKPSLNDNEVVNTNEAFNDMVKHSDHLVDQKAYLNVRLIDFLIADFDRHHGQYSWGTIDTNGRKMYYPIPKDRDQALYHNTGLVMAIGRWYAYKFMVNLPYRVRNVNNLGMVGAYMDKLYLNRLTEQDWQNTLDDFRTTLSDEIIHEAVLNMPPEVHALRGRQIEDKLKSRRNSIADKGMKYYRFVSKEASVLGGNKDEVFKVSGSDSGLLVQVYTKEENGDALKYSRNFDPAVTKEIRLYGFNGNDRFDIDESARARTRFNIVGGKGNDTFDIRGKVRNHIYDLSTEDNEILARRRTTKMFSPQPAVNEFKFRDNTHNVLYVPLVTFGFNGEDGALAGIGLSYKTFGFRKSPYASSHRLSTLVALTKKAYQLRYNGEFINVFRQYDLTVNAEHFNPALVNFFGYGNESVLDKARPIEYYRTRYDYVSADVLVRKRFLNDSVMSFSVGPSVYGYWNNPASNQAKILEQPSLAGLDSLSIYTRKFYGGGKAVFTVNNLNSQVLPIRGIDWRTEFTALKTLNTSAEPFTRLLSTMDIYAVLSEPTKLLATLHFGGGHIFSKNFEFFQALTLGGNNYLRGYRSNRFTGSSMAYGSAELKAKLFNFNAYVVKGDFGLVGFTDLGRVWMKTENSQKWHHTYGGGIYMIPFQSLMVSAVVAASEEEQLFNLTIGTDLNMMFQAK